MTLYANQHLKVFSGIEIFIKFGKSLFQFDFICTLIPSSSKIYLKQVGDLDKELYFLQSIFVLLSYMKATQMNKDHFVSKSYEKCNMQLKLLRVQRLKPGKGKGEESGKRPPIKRDQFKFHLMINLQFVVDILKCANHEVLFFPKQINGSLALYGLCTR